MTNVKYPGCTVQLTGNDGNAVIILGNVSRKLKRYLIDEKGWSVEDAEREVKAFREEAMSDDYDNVLATCLRWVTVA